jgi:RNA polymerase sigma-70 factor (ECF subfamily)
MGEVAAESERAAEGVDPDLLLVNRSLESPLHFRTLVERHEAKMRRYVVRRSGLPGELVDDILQDAFLRAYVGLSLFDKKLKFENWLYRIVRNALIDSYRRNKWHRLETPFEPNEEIPGVHLSSLWSGVDTGALLEDRERIRQALEALYELDEPYREAAILRFLEDKDYSEISDILMKPTGTVGSLVNRARKLIVQRLAEGAPSEPFERSPRLQKERP